MSRRSELLGSLLRTRWLVRAPVYAYKLRLGALFGHRMLLLEHIGRKTGARRYAVLEVVDRPAPDDFVVVSGFGERAQWYRNVIANPAVRVSVGWRHLVPATATPLTEAEVDATLDRYTAEHPRTWQTLKNAMTEATGSPDLHLPMLRLHLET